MTCSRSLSAAPILLLLFSACGGSDSTSPKSDGSGANGTGGGGGAQTTGVGGASGGAPSPTGGVLSTGGGGVPSPTGGALTTDVGGATGGAPSPTGGALTTGVGGATGGAPSPTGGALTTGVGGATGGMAASGGASTTNTDAGTGGVVTSTGGSATASGGDGTLSTGGSTTTGGMNSGGNATTSTGGSTGGSSTTATGGSTGNTCGTIPTGVGSLELYGTMESMGVIATIPEGSDPNSNAVATLEYRVAGTTDYAAGFHLTRVAPTRFVGTLFSLKHGTCYDVRVSYTDSDGAPLDGSSVSGSAPTRTEVSIPAPLRTLNVAPTGSGTDCSESLPCSLAVALGQARAGDEVLLRGGIYYTGNLVMAASGTSTAPIVIRGVDSAVLDGSDPSPFSWTSGAGGVFTTTVNQAGPHLVTVDGARLYPYADLQSVTTLSASNTPGFFINGTALTVHLTGNADPSSSNVRISRYNTGLTISGNFVYVVNVTFQSYGLGQYAKALYITDGSDNLVQNCKFITNDMGIGLKGSANRNVIQGNDISDTIFNWTYEDVQAEGNLTDGGMRFYAPADGRGNIIRRNEFHGMFTGLGICPASSAAVTNETDFYENSIHDNGNNGVALEARCANVRVWNNVIHDTLYGIKLAPVLGGPTYCLRNRIYRIGAGHSNAGLVGQSFRFFSGGAQSGWIYLFHNTVDAQNANNPGFTIGSPGTWQGIYARNNIWSGVLSAVENTNPSQPVDLDYDDLWSPDGSYLVHWAGLSNPNLAGLADLVSATGQESHGLSTAPQFNAPSTGDFTPLPSSLLIDKGLYIPGINDGFKGTAPDIGAIESQ